MPDTPVSVDALEDEAIVARLADELRATPHVLGAIWMGSRSRGEGIGPSSDIDLVAIIAEAANPKWRRGFRDAETGRHIEMLFRPPSLDRLRFRQCKSSGESWAHGYVNGRVLFDKDGTLSALIAEARETWDAGPDAMTDGDREWERYDMWLQREDIVDRVDTEPGTAAHLASMLSHRLLRFAYRLERRWYPPDKYLLRDLDAHDVPLAATFRRMNAVGSTPAVQVAALDDVFAILAQRYSIDFDAPYTSPASK